MKKIQTALAIALLLCLAPMPYGYYTLIRYVSAIVFAIMGYQYWEQNNKQLAIIWIALAGLFQPILKIGLDRLTWNLIDVIIAIWLFIIIWKDKEEQ